MRAARGERGMGAHAGDFLEVLTTLTPFLLSVAAVLVGFASVLRQGMWVVRFFKKICCTTTRMEFTLH
jgi:hypothetical protein